MSDNLFDRLFELFQSPGPINWKLAREVMRSVAGEHEPVEPGLAEEYQELAFAAELRLSDLPGLGTPASTPINPVDAATWADENHQSLRYLLEPLSEQLGGAHDEPATALFQPMVPALLGMQAGTMIGFMSHRTMGQFDTGLPLLENDQRYIVVPNVEGFASVSGLDAKQVRMWAVLHEIAHDVIMAVPWLRGHVLSVVSELLGSIEFDPGQLMSRIGDLASPEQLQDMMGDTTSLAALLGVDLDATAADPLRALTAFIEGYGDFAVARAGGHLLPDLEWIATKASERRAAAGQAEEAFQQLTGIAIDRGRAADAAAFCTEISRRWGTDALARAWEAPEHLPTVSELTDPVGWAARVLLTLGDLGIGDDPAATDS